jgi:mono/diheme cytochrome c family protein
MSQRTRRGLIFIGLVLLPFIIGLLLTYQVITVAFPTDMQFQPSIDYQEGPRLLPPEGAVSILGQTLVVGALPSNPVANDEVSHQRGEILYSIHCALCHGKMGQGDGPLEEFYSERPPSDLTAPNIAAQFDGALFRTISQGLGQMPALAENLTPHERWDVINYVRGFEE